MNSEDRARSSITAYVVNSFTLNGQGGNPAGVVLDASRISTAQRQQIAAQLRLSETAFLEPVGANRYRLEFFTPSRPIANCGHATIATFALLRQQGMVRGSESEVTISG